MINLKNSKNSKNSNSTNDNFQRLVQKINDLRSKEINNLQTISEAAAAQRYNLNISGPYVISK